MHSPALFYQFQFKISNEKFENSLFRKPRNRLILFLCTDASVGGDGQQGIPQLVQGNPKQIQFVLRQAAGQGIGNGRDGGRQLTGAHGMLTSEPSYARPFPFVTALYSITCFFFTFLYKEYVSMKLFPVSLCYYGTSA